ncbi:MAG: 4'-phosphopantetheinyl transferase superfamily protein [Ruminiclostridium sp.]|nr:4'-phosphopantetheinyl transferase superfamily protein [Ruminiclostridium sp.]
MNVYMYNYSGDGFGIVELAPFLGEQRYAYCSGMKAENAALQSAYAFMLLRYALKKEYGIFDIPVFSYNEHGKPFLADCPDIYFSLSHCSKTVLCAVSEAPVGVDVQDVRKISMRAAEKFLTETEYRNIEELGSEEERYTELCRLWCIKESYGKMTGKGFGEGFRSFEAQTLIERKQALCTRKNGLFLSVCTCTQTEKL